MCHVYVASQAHRKLLRIVDAMRKSHIALALLGCSAFLSGCANGSGAVPTTQGITDAAPAKAASGTIVVSPASLSFLSTAVKKNFAVSEKGYAGTFTATPNAKSCAKVASVAAIAKNKKAFTVTSGSKAGTCLITVADKNGHKTTVKAVVTLTTGVIH
jgi:hypothetical protein